jgi:hypothetical protein
MSLVVVSIAFYLVVVDVKRRDVGRVLYRGHGLVISGSK